ncbi:MAG TPA: hypothetical protein ENI13_02235 [candidate division CPR3 bacterium]|uniref:Uncharacterized protein n=1 Tax=candidate division CPR3 bacterium TaxID=2268181 RepID=A0A7C1T2C6_UNCC3|nr:hypothetical protein [candidate division CPR3 bacterium]
MFFEDYLTKGVYIRFNTEKGERKLVGVFEKYDAPLLLISSRGKKYAINKSEVLEIRMASGEVEP